MNITGLVDAVQQLVTENKQLKKDNAQLKRELKLEKAKTARHLPDTFYEKYETSLLVLRTMLSKAGMVLGAKVADSLLRELRKIIKQKNK